MSPTLSSDIPAVLVRVADLVMAKSKLWIATILFLSGNSVAHAENLLRWKLEAGAAYRIEMNQVIESETAIAAKPVRTTVSVDLGLRWDVKKVDENGAADIDQQIEFVALKMTVPPGEVFEFDSRNLARVTRGAKDIAEQVQPLVAMKFATKMDARGRIVDVQLPAETKKTLQGDGEKGSTNRRMLFTVERLEQLLRQSAAVLPDKAVSSGNSWEEKTTIKSRLGEMQQVTTFTHDGETAEAGDTMDVVRIAGKLELPKPNADPMELTIKNQSLSGTFRFLRSQGRLADLQIKQTLQTESKQRETTITSNSVNSLRTQVTRIAP